MRSAEALRAWRGALDKYAPASSLAVFILLALYGFRTSLGGRRLFELAEASVRLKAGTTSEARRGGAVHEPFDTVVGGAQQLHWIGLHVRRLFAPRVDGVGLPGTRHQQHEGT